jgi:hypothetical protein
MRRLAIFLAVALLALLGASFSDGGDSARAAVLPDSCTGSPGGSPSPLCGGGQSCSWQGTLSPNQYVHVCGWNYWTRMSATVTFAGSHTGSAIFGFSNDTYGGQQQGSTTVNGTYTVNGSGYKYAFVYNFSTTSVTFSVAVTN